jgi:hypothetical protein
MRTTLDLDEDVLTAAREIAKAEHKTVGAVISDLARKSLPFDSPPTYRGGFRLMRPTGKVITSEMVRRLVEEDG